MICSFGEFRLNGLGGSLLGLCEIGFCNFWVRVAFLCLSCVSGFGGLLLGLFIDYLVLDLPVWDILVFWFGGFSGLGVFGLRRCIVGGILGWFGVCWICFCWMVFWNLVSMLLLFVVALLWEFSRVTEFMI